MQLWHWLIGESARRGNDSGDASRGRPTGCPLAERHRHLRRGRPVRAAPTTLPRTEANLELALTGTDARPLASLGLALVIVGLALGLVVAASSIFGALFGIKRRPVPAPTPENGAPEQEAKAPTTLSPEWVRWDRAGPRRLGSRSPPFLRTSPEVCHRSAATAPS
jgi:hypothetical protein